MSIDITERLRALNDYLLSVGNDCSDVLLDAALTIDRLRAEVERLTPLAQDAGELMTENIGLRAEVEALRHVAAIAHSGGLLGMSMDSALTVIRRLTLKFWNSAGSVSHQKKTVSAAILSAKEATK